MASVFNRGSKAMPRWVAKFRDATGAWRTKTTAQRDRRAALKVAQELEAKGERQRLGLERPDAPDPLLGELINRWSLGLTNRSALHDRARVVRHLVPRFGAVRLSALDLAAVMAWLDEMRGGPLSPATQRHLLNLVSRFFSWCIERGLAQTNPVRSIPQGKRPQQSARRDVPWLEDDATVARLMRALPRPFDLLFFIGNRCGLRLGELCGLRLSDLAFIGEGAIRVCHSYTGPLKEDRHGAGMTKWAPCPTDAPRLLRPWLKRRRAQGAGDEDLAFPRPRGGHWNKEDVHARWSKARAAVGVRFTWYSATRHAFTSRLLAGGCSLDEVSAALGHSSPIVTRRHYDHLIRKSFPAGMRQGLKGLAA